MLMFFEGHPGWRRSFFVLFFFFFLLLIPIPGYAVTEVGLLTWKSSEVYEKAIEALQEQVREDSPHVVLVRRDAHCSRADFDRYLEEFSSRRIKVLVVLGSEATRMVCARDGGNAIPTVALCVSDPIGLELEGPHEESGCPLTGVSHFISPKKHLSLFSYLCPEAKKLAFLYDVNNPAGASAELPEIKRAARALGFDFLPLPVKEIGQLEGQVRKAVTDSDMVVLSANKLIFGNAGQIVQWAGDVPVFSLSEEGVPAGAVAALYADRYELGRVAARQVKAILEGTPASEIPFHYPRFEKLAVNLSSARRWGILIPRRIMERPSMVWRSSKCPEWYREDGSLKHLFRLQNDPDGRSFLKIGLVCDNVAESRPFLGGVIKGLQLGRSNYEVEMYDARDSMEMASSAIEMYQHDVDLLLTVGGGLLGLVKDRDLPVPVVFTGALVSEMMTLSWRNVRLTGSTYLLDSTRQVELLNELFGEDVPYIIARPLSSRAGGGESYLLYLEMLTSGLDVERVGLSSAFSEKRQAERLFRVLSERILRAGKKGPSPVLVVPNEGEVYRCLPDLGKMLSDSGLSVPVYVTSAWGLRWGGTVAPDVDPEEVGLVAGRYVIQILEQGIYPQDLPVWGGEGMNALCINRRWKEISGWSVPSTWDGPVREIVTEAMP